MHKNSPLGRAKIKLMTLSNVKLYPNQVMNSWFLTGISKTMKVQMGAISNSKRQKTSSLTHTFSQLIYGLETNSVPQLCKTGGGKKEVYAAPHLWAHTLSTNIMYLCAQANCTAGMKYRVIHQLLIKCQWRAPRYSLMPHKTWQHLRNDSDIAVRQFYTCNVQNP